MANSSFSSGQFLVLDAQHFDGIVIGLAGELGVGIVGGIGHVEILVVADIRAAQILVERLHRFFGADVAEHAVGLQRFAAAVGSAHQFQLRDSRRLRPARPSDGSKRRGALAHLLESLCDVLVGHFHRGHFNFQILVIAQLKFRQNFEDRAEFQRLAFGEIQLVHLRLRDRSQFLLGDGFFDALGHQRLQHFALDVVREAAADQRDRRLARTEAGHARNARKFLRHALHLFRYFFRGNFQIQFAAASCFSHGTIFSSVNDRATIGYS